MAQIVTVTFNPCIDKSTTIPALVSEKKLRCSTPVYEPGGGGINVARAIRKLGGTATAIYPSGGHSGKFFNALLQQEGIQSLVVDISNHTRENLIVMDQSTNQQYRFTMPGPELTEPEWRQCLQLLQQEDNVAYIVASGSLPPGVPVNIFAQIAQIAKTKNAKLIVDTSGPALQQAADEGVFLLKPNLGELSQLAGKAELQHEEIAAAACAIINKGNCEAVVVSLGAAGALLVTKDKSRHVAAPHVKRRSTVGAGDCMVAGIVWSLAKGHNLKEAVCYGVAAGTAATMNPGTGLCKPKDVETLYSAMKRC